MPGLVYEISISLADLRVPRMRPCSAETNMLGLLCGATPTSLYRRTCDVPSHDEKVWLCPVHAMIVICGAAICKHCAERGGVTGITTIERLSMPVRIS